MREHESNEPAGTAVSPAMPAAAAEDAALGLAPAREQVNMVCWSLLKWLVYLGAPILYVDVVQTTLCDRLCASRAVANLPTCACVFASLIAPVVVGAISQTCLLLSVLALLHVFLGLAGLAMAALLVVLKTPAAIIAATMGYGGLSGLLMVLVSVYRWEALSRGIPRSRQGRLLSLAYGVGPLFAIVGSGGAQYVLADRLPGFVYPWNYALLFAATAPLTFGAAFAACRMRISLADEVQRREPLVSSLFGGMWDYIRQPAFLLISAFYVMNNASLYAREAVRQEPQHVAGILVGLRFGGKAICGLLLGWTFGRQGCEQGDRGHRCDRHPRDALGAPGARRGLPRRVCLVRGRRVGRRVLLRLRCRPVASPAREAEHGAAEPCRHACGGGAVSTRAARGSFRDSCQHGCGPGAGGRYARFTPGGPPKPGAAGS